MKDGNSFRVNEITPATTAEIVTGTQFVIVKHIAAVFLCPGIQVYTSFMQERVSKYVKNNIHLCGRH